MRDRLKSLIQPAIAHMVLAVVAMPSAAEPGWVSNRQMDIRRVKISGAGGALKRDLMMNKVTTTWRPLNEFDHVAFTLFLEIPVHGGDATLMPPQNTSVPAGMRWHYRLRANGWANAFFSLAGATAMLDGTPATPAAEIQVDHARNTVSIVLPANALGRLTSLRGVKVCVTTGDHDGGNRTVGPEAPGMSLGGRKPGNGPVSDGRYGSNYLAMKNGISGNPNHRHSES